VKTGVDRSSSTGYTTTVEVFESPYSDVLCGPLEEVIRRLQDIFASVPEEFRSKVTMDVGAAENYGSASVWVTIEFDRPASPDEIEVYLAHRARMEKEERQHLLSRLHRLNSNLL
jgi:hypothetical protein